MIKKISDFLIKWVWYILFAGIALALLQRFGWNPLSVLQWLWSWIWYFITTVANFFTGNSIFQQVTR